LLSSARTRKRRYSVAEGAIDDYLEPKDGFAVYEVEFDDEDAAECYRPPAFVTREITFESAVSGISLAQRSTRN